MAPSIQFSNKVVYVGAQTTLGPTAGTGADFYPTPYSPRVSGVEINATTYLNLVRRDWLCRLPPLVQAGLVLGIGMSWALIRQRITGQASVDRIDA